MSTHPDEPPPVSPPEKPKMSAEERRLRQEDRLVTIRLRMMIGRELDERGITTPAAIGEALGMPAAEATKLLTRHQWRGGDMAQLEGAGARLRVWRPRQTDQNRAEFFGCGCRGGSHGSLLRGPGRGMGPSDEAGARGRIHNRSWRYGQACSRLLPQGALLGRHASGSAKTRFASV